MLLKQCYILLKNDATPCAAFYACQPQGARQKQKKPPRHNREGGAVLQKMLATAVCCEVQKCKKAAGHMIRQPYAGVYAGGVDPRWLLRVAEKRGAARLGFAADPENLY